jgi:HKD family nuclease
LCEHIKTYGNAGKGITSYLAVTIYEEIIELMGSKVLAVIATEIQKAKYFSISVDSTPDATHRSVNIILRSVKNAFPTKTIFAVYSHSWK